MSCEKPTLIERIIGLMPGSYFVKCLIFSGLVGVPFLLLTRLLDSLNFQTALAVFGPLSLQDIGTFCIANFVLVFYAVYGIRYMRSRLAAIMPDIQFLMPKASENGPQHLFGSICRLGPALIFSLLLMMASLISFPDQFSQHSAGILSLAQIVVSFPLLYLAYGTFIWVYSSAILSLGNLGRQDLILKKFYEDSHLGMKPIGTLSLSLALVYFSGLALVFFSFIVVPLPLEFAVVVMILGGIVLFFTPLFSFHERMTNAKRLELERLEINLHKLDGPIGNTLQGENKMEAQDMRRILAADIVGRHVSSIPVWPFETKTLTWLSAIVLAVVLSVVAKYVTVLFG